MIDVNKLKRKQAEALTEMRELADAVEKRDEDKRSLTPEELKRSTELQARVAALKTEISQAELLNVEEARTAENPAKRNGGGGDRGNGDGGGGDRGNGDGGGGEFRDFGGFINALVRGDTQNLESREMSMGVGSKGGFLVPKQFDAEIRAMQPDDGVVRPNAMVIPAGSTPDAAIDLPSLDQTGDKGVHGGIKMNWTGETGDKPSAGDPKFIIITLEPENITGYIDVTNKLLNNTTAFASYIQQLMAGAMVGAEEYAFYVGDGNGKPLGILNSDAVIKVERSDSGKITYQDLVNINAKIKGTNLKWVVNRSALPELQTMVPANTTALAWQPSAVVGAPDTILGTPVLYNEYSPSLGEFGDIALLDMKKYAIKDGTGLSIFLDTVTQYGSGKTRIYMSWNVDGQSLLKDSILSEDEKTRYSPFVVLD